MTTILLTIGIILLILNQISRILPNPRVYKLRYKVVPIKDKRRK